MSRCFPYPPPGHTLSKASNEALIESIKLQKLKEAKEQRKKEKREKKEKRKEKKEKKKEKKEKTEKRKEKANQSSLFKPDSAKGDISKNICTDTKGDFLHKTRESETEQLERSSLTEEKGQPICFRTSSSDSTENSNKRKRHSSSLDGNHSHGKKILVRLPSKKLDGDLPLKEQQQLKSTSRTVENSQNKVDTSLRDKPRSQPLPTLKVGQSLTLKTDRGGICSTSGRTEDLPPVKIRKSIQRLESQYNDLVVKWVPPPLDDASLYSEDLDWLCPGKKNRDVKRPKLENDSSAMSCSGSSGLWPRAQYLSDGDIYALPYTVPF